MQELIVIAVVALFVLGPERLPEVMRAGGRVLTKIRNYGVTASKELRGVADLRGLGGIEQEVHELRRELERTRADLRRAMRETVAASDTTTTPRTDLGAGAHVTDAGSAERGSVSEDTGDAPQDAPTGQG